MERLVQARAFVVSVEREEVILVAVDHHLSFGLINPGKLLVKDIPGTLWSFRRTVVSSSQAGPLKQVKAR